MAGSLPDLLVELRELQSEVDLNRRRQDEVIQRLAEHVGAGAGTEQETACIGHWRTEKGDPATVTQYSVMFPDESEVKLTATGDASFRLGDGMRRAALLGPDRLRWRDGELWHRVAAAGKDEAGGTASRPLVEGAEAEDDGRPGVREPDELDVDSPALEAVREGGRPRSPGMSIATPNPAAESEGSQASREDHEGDEINLRKATGLANRVIRSMSVFVQGTGIKKRRSKGYLYTTQETYMDMYINPTWRNHPVLGYVARFFKWWYFLVEPPRTGCLASVIRNPRFNLLCGLAIVCNCVVAVIIANYEGTHFAAAPEEFRQTEFLLSLCYVAEVLMRIAVHRGHYFCNEDMGQNLMDFTLVTLEVSSQLAIFLQSKDFLDVSFLRSARIMKVARILRLMRAMTIFSEIRLLMNMLLTSVGSVFWCGIVLVFALLMAALFFTQIVTDYIMMYKLDENQVCVDLHCEQLKDHFGSVQEAMLALYMATTGGVDWVIYIGMLDPVGGGASFCFVAFTFGFQFGIFNLLTSMFVDRTLKTSKPDIDGIVMEQRAKEQRHTLILKNLLQPYDADGNGRITLEEFDTLMDDKQISGYLAATGLEVHDARLFFTVLMDMAENEDVPIDDFVQGCMRLKGSATSIDQQVMSIELRRLSHKFGKFEADSKEMFRKLNKRRQDKMTGHGLSGFRPLSAMECDSQVSTAIPSKGTSLKSRSSSVLSSGMLSDIDDTPARVLPDIDETLARSWGQPRGPHAGGGDRSPLPGAGADQGADPVWNRAAAEGVKASI